ncbi:IS66 family transposase [Lacticaseibacillus paracasei]|uniref:IS66 family transposase n=1 Tax=Lacticaseibacillus paracasei TaxID=1597 RepID=UPI003B589CAE
MATASLLVKIIHDKYKLDVPLYRQIKKLQRLGLDVSETTLCHWRINSAEVLAPLYDLMHNALIHQPFLQGDETPTQVLKEPGRKATSKSYMWVARTVRSCDTTAVYYTYNQSRGGQVAKDLYSVLQASCNATAMLVTITWKALNESVVGHMCGASSMRRPALAIL